MLNNNVDYHFTEITESSRRNFRNDILRMNGQNLTKFCIHIIIDKIYVGIVNCFFFANLQQSYDP